MNATPQLRPRQCRPVLCFPTAGRRALASVTTAVFAVSVLLSPAAHALTVSTAPISFTGVTLNGAPQVVNDSPTPWQVDATGESGGWHLTVASADFTNAATRSIAVANFEIRLLDSKIVLVAGDPVRPTPTQSTFAPLSGTPLKIASAAMGTGNGIYDLTPDFRLTVPAATYTGSYSATVTVSVAVGP